MQFQFWGLPGNYYFSTGECLPQDTYLSGSPYLLSVHMSYQLSDSHFQMHPLFLFVTRNLGPLNIFSWASWHSVSFCLQRMLEERTAEKGFTSWFPGSLANLLLHKVAFPHLIPTHRADSFTGIWLPKHQLLAASQIPPLMKTPTEHQHLKVVFQEVSEDEFPVRVPLHHSDVSAHSIIHSYAFQQGMGLTPG